MNSKIPERLYKFRRFDMRALAGLIDDELYFASPSTFNDPLDTRPALFVDVDVEVLKQLLSKLVIRRVSAETETAAKKLNVRGERTDRHIERVSRVEASRLIDEIEYYSTYPGADRENLVHGLKLSIERELVQRYDKGVFCLSERYDCPVLWSHYGYQHRGVCIGYSVPSQATQVPAKVKYTDDRLVYASKVAAMLDGDEDAGREVDDAVLLQKGQSWKYETEWRVVGHQGPQYSQFEMEEIIFGVRNSKTEKLAVIKVFESREKAVTFYEMRENPSSFKLEKHCLNFSDESFSDFPRRSLSTLESFADLSSVDCE